MTNLLPIVTVVRLHNGTIDVMIIGRFPLYNQEGTIGYFWLCKIDEDSWENKKWKRTLWGWCEEDRGI